MPPLPLPAGALPGTVLAVFPDALGHTVVVAHAPPSSSLADDAAAPPSAASADRLAAALPAGFFDDDGGVVSPQFEGSVDDAIGGGSLPAGSFDDDGGGEGGLADGGGEGGLPDGARPTRGGPTSSMPGWPRGLVLLVVYAHLQPLVRPGERLAAAGSHRGSSFLGRVAAGPAAGRRGGGAPPHLQLSVAWMRARAPPPRSWADLRASSGHCVFVEPPTPSVPA